MKKAVKILSLLLSVSLLFCACGKQTPAQNPPESTNEAESAPQNVTGEPAKKENIRLPYNETDGINPFFAKSYENLYLAKLLYNGLFTVTADYTPEPLLASGISISGNTATVTLKSGLACHGSGNINANDVVYSFNMAKGSYAYSYMLEGVESAAAAGNSVIFTLKLNDSKVAAKLTFPIVKVNSADLQSGVPIGHGSYYFYENTLVSADGSKKDIPLTLVSTADSALNAYKIGNTDILFSDLSDCKYTQLHGKATTADLNNMVYLGINGSLGGLNKNIRAAIAVLLNNEEITAESYQGHAVPVKAPFNPASAAYKNMGEGQIPLSGDMAAAQKIIDRCGYTRYAGKALTNGAYVLSFSLIVNKDNKYRVSAAYMIADALNAAGFYIEVKQLSFEDYSERIASGNFDLYLGETKLDSSMDLSQFFFEGGKTAKGVHKGKVTQDYIKMRAGEISEKDFMNTFAEFYPFVPIAFRTGAVFSSEGFGGDFSHFPNELYYGF